MTTTTHDLAILGLGGVGSAIAYHAARRGLDVVAIDAATPGHDEAASSAPWRAFRAAYPRDARYMRLAEQARELWRVLWRVSGRTLLDPTGALLVAEDAHPALRAVESCVASHGMAIESWSREDIHARTALEVPPGFRAVFERDAGLLRADDCNSAHRLEATRAGARLLAPIAVTALEAASDHFRVVWSEGEARARWLVIAAGVGASALLDMLDPTRPFPITLERHPEQWFAAPPDLDTGPPFNVLAGPGARSFHGHPNVATRGMMIARHRGGRVVTSAEDRSFAADDAAEVRAFAATFMPKVADAPLVRRRVHFYVNLPDDNFLVGATHTPRLLLATGLCGHGFKFASALGLGVVERVVGDAPTVDLTLFDPARFD